MAHLCSPASDSPPAVSRTQCLRIVIKVELEPRLAQDSCGQGQQAARRRGPSPSVSHPPKAHADPRL